MFPILIAAAILGAAGAAVFFLKKKKTRPPLATTPFAQWDITYSEGCPPAMAKQPNGEYTVDVPAAPGSIHYVTTAAPLMGATIKMVFAVQGTGTIIPKPTTDDPPAKVTLFLQRKGDNLSGLGEFQFYRWWSNAHAIVTNAGEFTLTSAVDPALWHPVGGNQYIPGPNYAQDRINGFNACLGNLDRVGFTFGGASFDGHGNQSTGGPVTFVLRSFGVQ